MAINYTPVNWNTSTTFLNPVNLNKMDGGVKQACDGVDMITKRLGGCSIFVDYPVKQLSTDINGDVQVDFDVPDGTLNSVPIIAIVENEFDGNLLSQKYLVDTSTKTTLKFLLSFSNKSANITTRLGVVAFALF